MSYIYCAKMITNKIDNLSYHIFHGVMYLNQILKQKMCDNDYEFFGVSFWNMVLTRSLRS